MAYSGKSGKDIDNCITSYFKENKPSVGLGVIIKNSSSYELEYVNSGYCSGYPVKPIVEMFEKRDQAYVISPGKTGGLVWDRHGGGEFGKWIGNVFSLGIAQAGAQSYVEGYISVRARTTGKNHIVCLGFILGRNRCNKCGIQIRGEDGVLDDMGNVSGHGTDPTGNVTDIYALASTVPHTEFRKDKDGIFWHEFYEGTRAMRIKGELNNEDHGKVIFEIFDAKP
jgi:hypothetical protein